MIANDQRIIKLIERIEDDTRAQRDAAYGSVSVALYRDAIERSTAELADLLAARGEPFIHEGVRYAARDGRVFRTLP